VRKDRLRRLEKLEEAKKAKNEPCPIAGVLYFTRAQEMRRPLIENERWNGGWTIGTWILMVASVRSWCALLPIPPIAAGSTCEMKWEI